MLDIYPVDPNLCPSVCATNPVLERFVLCIHDPHLRLQAPLPRSSALVLPPCSPASLSLPPVSCLRLRRPSAAADAVPGEWPPLVSQAVTRLVGRISRRWLECNEDLRPGLALRS